MTIGSSISRMLRVEAAAEGSTVDRSAAVWSVGSKVQRRRSVTGGAVGDREVGLVCAGQRNSPLDDNASAFWI